MGCFVHVVLLGVGCFVSLQKNMWWFLSTYNKMDVGGYVRGVFCPYTDLCRSWSGSQIVVFSYEGSHVFSVISLGTRTIDFVSFGLSHEVDSSHN